MVSLAVIALIGIAVAAVLLAVRSSAGIVVGGVVLSLIAAGATLPEARVALSKYLMFDYRMDDDSWRDSVSEVVRYKLVIDALVDGRRVTASSIQELGIEENPSFLVPAVKRFVLSVRGEAVYFDLGSRGLLFAAMSQLGSRVVYQNLLLASCGVRIEKDESASDVASELRAGIQNCDVPDTALPAFLLTPPSSAQIQWKSAPLGLQAPSSFQVLTREGVAAHFGNSVQILRARVEAAEQPLTFNQLQKIMWLRAIVEGNPKNFRVEKGDRFAYIDRDDFMKEHFQ